VTLRTGFKKLVPGSMTRLKRSITIPREQQVRQLTESRRDMQR